MKYGDVDGDGTVTVDDALTVCQFVLRNITLTDAQQRAADVDGDNSITVDDALTICQYVLRNITEFPAEKNS